MAVPHLALDLGLGHERGDRVDDDDVDGAGADQHVHDLERLLTGVRLGDEQRVGVDAELLGVLRSSACSASMKAAMPPAFCALATACSASVVLPEDSGP